MYGYNPESNWEYTEQAVLSLENRSEAHVHDRRNRLTNMDRGTLTYNQETGLMTVEDGDFLAHATLKQKEDWPGLDRRGNWRDYRDAVYDNQQGSIERIEKREANDANAYTKM